ncbi:MAG: hypothetical protein A3E78_16635 [Alphaproteobacteria bacterium RIFCSPHIGHO2_12_FULL_63_12]|nr:MAG: hypothetical protein A3E78_16635 [Alphaproteobacteria bacterium RIFCSPHIGHO2_12_FULL_63_12]
MRQLTQRGFTIIEALVALMILSIAATAVMSVFAVGARQIESRTARYELYREAQSRLSMLKAEVRAAALAFDRETVVDGLKIREAAQLAQIAGGPEDPATLFEVAVFITDPSAENNRRVELSGFVIVEPAQ